MKSFNFTTLSAQLADFDLGGVLYHGNYFRLFEQSREAFLREAGIPYSDLVNQSLHLAVVECDAKFLKPIFYGSPITVQLQTRQVKSTTVRFCYQVFQNDNLCNEAMTKHVLVRIASNSIKPERFPGQLKRSFVEICSEENQ